MDVAEAIAKGREYPGTEDTLGAEQYVKAHCSELSPADQYQVVVGLINHVKKDGIAEGSVEEYFEQNPELQPEAVETTEDPADVIEEPKPKKRRAKKKEVEAEINPDE